MSRTDAHAPLPVRLSRGDLPRTAIHDHRDGVCNLPDSPNPAEPWMTGNCSWVFVWTGINICGCRICTGADTRRQDRRRDRHQSRLALRRWTPEED